MDNKFTIGDAVSISGHNELKYGHILKNPDKGFITVEAFSDYGTGIKTKIKCKRDELTLIPPVHLSGEDLKHLIRYEVSFSDLIKSETPFSNYVLDGDYNTTLEDLKTAVINLREKNANFEDYSHDWFENIYYDKSLTDALHIPPYEYNDDGFGKYRKEILPVREDIVKRDVFEMIGEFTEDYEMLCDDNFQKKFPFDEILRKITYFTEDKDKPLNEKRFTEGDMRKFISFYKENEFKNLDDEHKAFYRKTVDELCLKNDETALRIKAYSCYGGNDIYPCNWNISKDCLVKLFNKTGDEFAANSLGYIYYYGRCNGGKPQYEEAYKYFSYGAFNGIYESKYKIGDMFAKGYGVPKMPEAAFRLYYEVYIDNLKYFSQGDFLCKFADAALRLGKGCESGITPYYMESDYFYCLQADYAIRKRLNFDCFGDGAVYDGIQKALNESKENFHKFSKPQKAVRYTDWKVLRAPVSTYGRSAKAVIKKLTNGNVQITISATKSDYEFDARKNMILFTVPEADYCNLLKKITFKIVNVKKCEILNGKTSFIYDNVDWDYKKGQHVFKCNGEEVARITADDLIWKAPKEDTKKIVKLRFAGVQFTKNGKEYDYLCDDKSIREGDTVIVEGIDGETKVKVCKIFEREEIKNEIPESFYKSVIRKC